MSTELDRLRLVAKAALRARMAHFQALQNEGEVANGGRDWGQDELEQEEVDATEALDDVLGEVFGGCWDLGELEEVFARISK